MPVAKIKFKKIISNPETNVSWERIQRIVKKRYPECDIDTLRIETAQRHEDGSELVYFRYESLF